MGHFFQAMYNIFHTFFSSLIGIKNEFADKPDDKFSLLKNAFSKENAKRWLYFIPAVIFMILAGVIFVNSI